MLAREQRLQVALRLLHAAAGTQLPAARQAVNVRIDRKRGHAEGLRHHHARGLVAHAGQRLQFLESPRHLAAVLLDENP